MGRVVPPASICRKSDTLSLKSEPKENSQCNFEEYKHCFDMNKAIEKVVYEQNSSAELKLEFIKKILFKNGGAQKDQTELA